MDAEIDRLAEMDEVLERVAKIDVDIVLLEESVNDMLGDNVAEEVINDEVLRETVMVPVEDNVKLFVEDMVEVDVTEVEPEKEAETDLVILDEKVIDGEIDDDKVVDPV
jgi:hypothetical protein